MWLGFLLFICLAYAAEPDSKAQMKPMSSESGIEGVVTIGPVCPVERTDQPCPDKPFAASITVAIESSGQKVTTVRSGFDGKFRVKLSQGTYRLTPEPPNRGAPPNAEPQTVTVERGKYAHIVIKYDSGIR